MRSGTALIARALILDCRENRGGRSPDGGNIRQRNLRGNPAMLEGPRAGGPGCWRARVQEDPRARICGSGSRQLQNPQKRRAYGPTLARVGRPHQRRATRLMPPQLEITIRDFKLTNFPSGKLEHEVRKSEHALSQEIQRIKTNLRAWTSSPAVSQYGLTPLARREASSVSFVIACFLLPLDKRGDLLPKRVEDCQLSRTSGSGRA